MREKAVLILLAVLLLVSCSRIRIDPNAGPDTLYQQGVAFYQSKKYKPAIETLKELVANHPEFKGRTEAELLLADAYYYNGQYLEASDAYLNFRNGHPTHAKIPYAVYMTGLAFMKQSLSIDRDQSLTNKALKEFEAVVSEFPSSEYAKEAGDKLNLASTKLAQREFYVGEFYHRQGQYNGALGRFYTILEKYRNSALTGEALLYIARSHLKLGQAAMAKQALTAYRAAYPKSPGMSEAKEILKEVEKLPPEGTPPKRSLWSRLNPLNLFAGEKAPDEAEESPFREAVMAKRKSLLASLVSKEVAEAPAPEARPSPSPARQPDKIFREKAPQPTPAVAKQAPRVPEASPGDGKIANHPQASVQGKSCTSCHQVSPEHGSVSQDGQPKSFFQKFIRWLGL